MVIRRHLWKGITAFVVVLYAIGAIELHRSGSFSWKPDLSADGVATLAGGSLAFLAVMLQLEAERNARLAEEERQTNAVATALLFEIDLVYRLRIRDTAEKLVNAGNEDFLVKTQPLRFHVYEGMVGEFGRLPPAIVQSIIRCYGAITRWLTTLEAYSVAIRSAHEPQTQGDWEGVASECRRELTNSYPRLRCFIASTSQCLCDCAQAKFEYPIIAVAQLSDAIRQLEKPDLLPETE